MKFALFGCMGAALLALAACDNSASDNDFNAVAPKSDPFEVYASPWDHDSDEVQKNEFGLEWIVLNSGKECDSGAVGSEMTLAHYEGRVPNGTKFDSSFDRNEPAAFPANGVIPGWSQALGLMCPGDDWLIYVPNQLAYGPQDRGPIIKGGDDLIFRLVVIDALTASQFSEDVWSGDAFLPKED